MKSNMINLAKLNVLSCEPRMSNDTQEIDSKGNKVWDVEYQTERFNSKHQITETKVLRAKSLIKIEKGNQLVCVRVFAKGIVDGNYAKVTNYHTITSKVPEDAKIGNLFKTNSSEFCAEDIPF